MGNISSLENVALEDGIDVLDMLNEIPALESGFENSASNLQPELFREYLKQCASLSEENHVPAGQVRMTTYWLRIDDHPVGISRIFHLNNFSLLGDILNNVAFISYCIRPSERNKKYGNLILRKTLEKVIELKYEKMLLVCGEENIASKKCITNNGGILGKTHDRQCHYWVNHRRDEDD
jgi:predicted acetyltransferase